MIYQDYDKMCQLTYNQNKIMAQETSPHNIQHLQNLFNKRSPKTKYFSQSRIEQFNDSIMKQIINGDTEVNLNQYNRSNNNHNRYEEDKRRHQLVKAGQEKEELERKLAYLNRSIDSIKKYSYLKGQNHPEELKKSREQSQEESQALKNKNRELILANKKHKAQMEKTKKELQQKRQKQIQEELQQQKKYEEKEKQKRKKEILQNMKRIKKEMEERQIQNQKSTEKVKEIINKKQLFHKFEEQFKERQLITLEERKRKLSEIRNFHRPIDVNEIKQHQKKVQEMKRDKQELRLREKKINQSSVSFKPSYVSSYYKEIAEQLNSQQENQSKLKIDKIKQFSQHIKEHFQPHASERKRRQLQEFLEKEQQKKRLREQKLQQIVELRKKKGVQYMEYLRKIPKKKGSTKIEDQGSKTARPAYKNYLSHSTSENTSPNKTEQTWAKILTKKQLNKKQKARLLQYQSDKMEQILKRKQQEGRLLKKDNEEQIDQEYYNMIKAKLSLLTSQH